MSQKSSRKSATVVDEKEKNQPESPAKDLKKKMAAGAEKEKPAADKPTTEKNNKPTDKKDKPTDKKEKPTDKQNGDKKVEKQNGAAKENGDKTVEKTLNKSVEKASVSKSVEKATVSKSVEKEKDKAAEKKLEEEKAKGDGKPEKNGKAEVKPSNGHTNGSRPPSQPDRDSDDAMVIDDELFPELAYDDSDVEVCETPDELRSVTRRSQVKPTRTPETPRPASDKQETELEDKREVSRTPDTTPIDCRDTKTQDNRNESKDTKILKLKEDPPSVVTERKLRSTDSPKKAEEVKTTDGAKKADVKENGDKEKTREIVVVIEDCDIYQEGESRKPDTNFSKSRVKVSPYRRSGRLADQTTTSIVANYTGNNTTMETDISTGSILEDSVADDSSSYISGLRNIRGRRSYKPYKEMVLRSSGRKPPVACEPPSRPTGTVVGRKRKQDEPELARDLTDVTHLTNVTHPTNVTHLTNVTHAVSQVSESDEAPTAKRVRLLERFMSPFRRVASSTPLPARRAAPIVGINTDLPLSAPVAASSTFDPEVLKPEVTPDAKRCLIM